MTPTSELAMLCHMQEAPRCPVCGHTEWVRGNMVVVPGADGPVRAVTRCPHGSARWTCASCDYADRCDGEISRCLERIPAHVADLPGLADAAGSGLDA